jgi:hypothetical protein
LYFDDREEKRFLMELEERIFYVWIYTDTEKRIQ